MECAWEALENAGYAVDKYPHPIGLFAGAGHNHYLERHLLPNKDLVDTVGWFPIMLNNTKDNMCPKIAYKLGLTGPAVAVQTACSTALSAIHGAIAALRNGDCRLALAGGVSLGTLEREGYLFEEGMLQPRDGVTRSFDAAAEGSVPGQGAGVVVLARLEDAVREGATIYAVIRGSAMGNDGSDKENYTTYSTSGQRRVIEAALRSAGLKPEDISHVETSSTASVLGDPIEMEALIGAFGAPVAGEARCTIGAVKPNVGNADAAAGLAALLKATLAVHEGMIPPNIGLETPNPKVDWADSRFRLPVKAEPWRPASGVRRAGVSAFGMGGTNAHIILEQAPKQLPTGTCRPWQIITLSGSSEEALERGTDDLIAFLEQNPRSSFPDVVHTLRVGRKDLAHRRVLVSHSAHEAVLELRNPDSEHVFTKKAGQPRETVFMFPGQGAQYRNMGRELYLKEPFYRSVAEECWEIIRENVGWLYQQIAPTRQDRGGRTEKLNRTYFTQPALFITEYALAKTLIHWGIEPAAMIGNSLGEYVAACISGVFSLEDALEAVTTRGRLMQETPEGSGQLMAMMSEQRARDLIEPDLSLAAVLGPEQVVISGTREAIARARIRLTEMDVEHRRMHVARGFHSPAMDGILGEYTEVLGKMSLSKPEIPFISNVSGTWISDQQAVDPSYWARHLREPVRFWEGLTAIMEREKAVLLEVGPGHMLREIACARIKEVGREKAFRLLTTLPQPNQAESDMHYLLKTVGRLWLNGATIDWERFNEGYHRRRVPLPTHPFARTRHWLDPVAEKSARYWLEPDEIEVVAETSAAESRGNLATKLVLPRNEDEQEVARIWREFLGVGEVGIHDDFFELGGTSLIAVRLAGKLGQTFNVPMASHTLLKRRTIASLAEYIGENRAGSGENSEESVLVEIQRGSSRALPLYMVHPVGGEVYFYKDLAYHLGAGQPLYGIQAPSLVGNTKPFDDISEQAASYLDEILTHQKEPPYVIGGSSYGGVVAYEMSQQLHARGIPVALTILVDSPAPGAMPGKTADFADILDYLLGDELEFDVEELRELPAEEQLDYVFEEAKHVNRIDILPPALGIPMFRTWMAHQDALHKYRPQPYPGRVIFYRPTELAKLNVLNMHLPWIDLVRGGIEIHQVPGNHITMNAEPNVRVMADHLKRALRNLYK